MSGISEEVVRAKWNRRAPSEPAPAPEIPDDWMPPESFAEVLARYPQHVQDRIRAKLAEQQQAMAEFRERGGVPADSAAGESIREWTTAYYEVEAQWMRAARKLLELCDCAATPPTMPTARTTHLPTCPAFFAGVGDLPSPPAHPDSERLDWLLTQHALSVTFGPPLRDHYIDHGPTLGRADIDICRAAAARSRSTGDQPK